MRGVRLAVVVWNRRGIDVGIDVEETWNRHVPTNLDEFHQFNRILTNLAKF